METLEIIITLRLKSETMSPATPPKTKQNKKIGIFSRPVVFVHICGTSTRLLHLISGLRRSRTCESSSDV